MIKAWTEEAWEDFEYWTTQDRRMLKRILQEGHDRGELVVPDINSTAYLLLKSFKSLEAPYINRYHHEYGKEDYLRIIAAMKQLLRQGLTNHANTKPITQ